MDVVDPGGSRGLGIGKELTRTRVSVMMMILMIIVMMTLHPIMKIEDDGSG